jgi:hypothetical protein
MGFRHVGEATVFDEECGPCPDFLSYTLAFALQLRKNHGKTSVRVAEKCQLDMILFVNGAAIAAVTDCNHQHTRLALQVGQINPW